MIPIPSAVDQVIRKAAECERKYYMNQANIRLLFIGNSHTYYNDLPAIVAELAEEDGYDCQITMLAKGGWYLEQHVKEPETRFNILHGKYDYVILQEYSHPFGPEEQFFDSIWQMEEWIRKAKSRMVLYMTWSRENEPDAQGKITAAYRQIALETEALLVPVGEEWWKYREANPSICMYAEDGGHPSEYGSWFAARHIWEMIRVDLEETHRFMNPDLEDYLEDLAYIESLEYLDQERIGSEEIQVSEGETKDE